MSLERILNAERYESTQGDLLSAEEDPEAHKALFAGILRRAIFDWILYRGHGSREKRRLAGEAYTWLFVEKPGHSSWARRLRGKREMLSFHSICDIVQVSPDTVNRVAGVMTAQDIQKLGRPATRRRVATP